MSQLSLFEQCLENPAIDQKRLAQRESASVATAPKQLQGSTTGSVKPAGNGDQSKPFKVGDIVKCTQANHQYVQSGQVGEIVQYPVIMCSTVAIVEFGNERHPNRWAVKTENLAFL